jgi:hypothetical protein
MEVPFLGEVPIDPEILVSGETGRPFAGREASHPGARAFAGIVSRILEPRHAMSG